MYLLNAGSLPKPCGYISRAYPPTVAGAQGPRRQSSQSIPKAIDADRVHARRLLQVPPSAQLLTTCAHRPTGCGPVFAEPVPLVGSGCARG